MPRLDEVFKKSGVPTYTFVTPSEFDRVLVALRTPGRGLIIEGPSGIGKTSCVKKALEAAGMTDSCLLLSARRPADQDYIIALPTMRKLGVVVVDDFHHLHDDAKKDLTNFLKLLADEEDTESKVILIGINRSGQSLIDYAPDLLGRVEIIKVGRANVERLRELIALGERALNCTIAVAEDIATEVEGSFAMAQVLCHEACIQGKVLETQPGQLPQALAVSLPSIREAVLRELSTRFFPIARDFATGNKLRREGRAPYLHLLRWLSVSREGALDTKEAIAANPRLKASVSQVINKGHLGTLLSSSRAIGDLIYFDTKSELLIVEDPKFLYFTRHIIWSKFATQVGYFSIEFNSRYDFALSFAGENRALAEALFQAMQEREVSVFYDKNEQHRILANDVEEYLAPIYRSEARFIIPLMSKEFPKKIWTKFESDQFKERFGEKSVIPLWFTDCPVGTLDAAGKVGGLSFDPAMDIPAQVTAIVDTLAKRLEEERTLEAANTEPEGPDAVTPALALRTETTNLG
jgi:hypothetical protein